MKALVDCGCSVTLISDHSVGSRQRGAECLKLETMGGSEICVKDVVQLTSVKTMDGVELGPISAHVMPYLPLQVDIVIGLDIINEHGLIIERARDGGKVWLRALVGLLS